MAWFTLSLFVLALLVLGTAAAWQGRRLASWPRRLLVALCLAAAVTLPAVPTLLLGGVIGRGTGLTVRAVDGTAVELASGSPDYATAACIWFILLIVVVGNLRLPGHLRDHHHLPHLSDGDVRSRIGALAACLGLRPPQVVESADPQVGMAIHALTGGLLAPIIVVSDGVLHRLPPRERDAVIAHELAHLARRDVVRMVLSAVATGLLAVLLSCFLPFLVSLVFFVAASAFARNLVSQRNEILADRRAAQCAGWSHMANALDKVHAAGLPFAAGPWFHALLSHPALDVRAFHLRQSAPPAEGSGIGFDIALVRRCRLARRLALFVWMLALAAIVWWGTQPWGQAPAIILGFLLLGVPLLPYLAVVRLLLWSFQLGLPHRLVAALKRLCFFLLAIAGLLLVSLDDAFFLPSLACLAAALFWGMRERSARRTLNVHLLQRDLTGWLDRYRQLPPRWQRTDLQVEAATVRAALGERDEAVRDLLALRTRRPHCHTATLAAATVLRASDPPQAVACCRQMLAALPANPFAEGMLASALRYDGQLDEARQRVQAVQQRMPRLGQWSALAVRIAIARGDQAGATAELAKAERLDPGGLVTVLARAEYAVHFDPAQAPDQLAKLRQLLAHAPLAFLDDELQRLEGQWQQSTPG